MGCLSNWIGLDFCSASSSLSGLNINSMPGISFKQLSGIADSEQQTAIGVWNAIKQRSEQAFYLALNSKMSKTKYQLINPKYSYNLSKVIDADTVFAAGIASSVGFTVRMNKGYEDYPQSRMAAIHCQSLAFYISDADDVNDSVQVKIFDIIAGVELFSDTVTAALGWNFVSVNQTFHNQFSDNSLSLYCFLIPSGIQTVYKEVNIDLYRSDNELSFKGATATTNTGVVDDDITEGSNSYGLTGLFQSVCLWEALICQNKQLATMPFMYILTVEALTEQIYTERFNLFASPIKTDKAKELREEYSLKFDDALQQMVDAIRLDTSDPCLVCSNDYQILEATP
jgi:hypothetical protein